MEHSAARTLRVTNQIRYRKVPQSTKNGKRSDVEGGPHQTSHYAHHDYMYDRSSELAPAGITLQSCSFSIHFVHFYVAYIVTKYDGVDQIIPPASHSSIRFVSTLCTSRISMQYILRNPVQSWARSTLRNHLLHIDYTGHACNYTRFGYNHSAQKCFDLRSAKRDSQSIFINLVWQSTGSAGMLFSSSRHKCALRSQAWLTGRDIFVRQQKWTYCSQWQSCSYTWSGASAFEF